MARWPLATGGGKLFSVIFSQRSRACLAVLLAGASCSTSASLQGPGGACAVATDCNNGYVCIHGVCTNDLDAIAKTEVASGSRDATMAVTPSFDASSDSDGSSSPDATSGNEEKAPEDTGMEMLAEEAGARADAGAAD